MGQIGGTVIPWAPGFRLTQALATAGGISTGGDKNDIRIRAWLNDTPRGTRPACCDWSYGTGHDLDSTRATSCS